jgi:hypothetical protein
MLPIDGIGPGVWMVAGLEAEANPGADAMKVFNVELEPMN